MKFFIVASLLALAAAEPVMDTPSVQAAKVAHHAAVVHDTAVHMQAKANAAMYKAHVPHVYQTPYVYNYNPVVYKAPEVKAPAVTYTAPVTYTQQAVAPVTYTHHQVATPVTYTTPFAHQSMVYNAPAYVPTFHSLHKREAEAEAEADPQVFYNTYGYYPQGYTPVYTHQVAPVVYTKPEVEVKKVEQPAVTYTVPTYTAPVTYTKTVNPVVYKAPVGLTAPLTYTHHQVATPFIYNTPLNDYQQAVVYNHAYPQFNTLFKREIEAEPIIG